MQIDRRQFAVGAAAAMSLSVPTRAALGAESVHGSQRDLPCFVSTWPFGKPGNDVALKTIHDGKSVLDAIEQGIRTVEADVSNTSVGIGGTPNASGVVSLDACIMNGPGHQAGSVGGVGRYPSCHFTRPRRDGEEQACDARRSGGSGVRAGPWV